VTCAIETTSSTLSPFLSLILLKVKLRYVYNHPCILFAATLCGGYWGAEADTLYSSCLVILSAGYGVLDVEAAVAGARCTGRLTSCGILSSSVIATAIRVLSLSIAVADIITDL
jgi:hypothetical protein